MTKEEMEAAILELETKKADVDKNELKEYAPHAWKTSQTEALILDMLIKLLKHQKDRP